MTPIVRKEGSLLLALVLISISANIAISSTIAQSSSEFQSTDDRLIKAYEYILSRYNATLGLVSESKDEGKNAVNGTSVNDTYWIYSDNLWAAEALRPYNPEIAENISRTVQSYIKEYGNSMLFEAALGEEIPTTIHAGKNIIAFNGTVNGKWVQILLDRHQPADNPNTFPDADEFADLCSYMTINYWIMGNTSASEYWFKKEEEMWNCTTNNGFYDKAVYDKTSDTYDLYANMKLGLFLLAQRVTGFQSNITIQVEATAWSYQLKNGGIASLSYMNGSVYGTANVETTSALLLAYDYDLIGRLLKKQFNALTASYQQLLMNYTALETNYTKLQEDLTYTKDLVYVLTAITVILIAAIVYVVVRKPLRKI
jgi:hypothetical protein